MPSAPVQRRRGEPASAYNVGWAVRKVSLWVGDLQLSKFSALTLVNIQRQAANDGLEPVTIRRILRTFKKAVREAVHWQLFPPDAITALDNAPVIRVKKKQPALRTIEESGQLADALRSKYPAIADMVMVAAYTGMRFGEIAALSWDQVDLTRNKLTVDRTLSKGEDMAYRVKMSPKTEAGNRTIPLAPEVVEIFESVVPEQEPRSSLIFLTKKGNLHLPATASNPVRKAAQKLGVPHGFHCSRHYWASLMISRNVPLPTVSSLLGHSSARVTMEEYAWCVSDPSENDAVLGALSGAGGNQSASVPTPRRNG